MNWLTASKEEQAAEIMRRGLAGEPLAPDEILAIYANESNWVQDYSQGRCNWVWQGPVICAYELARIGVRTTERLSDVLSAVGFTDRRAEKNSPSHP